MVGLDTWTRPFVFPRLRLLVCKMGVTVMLALEAFCVKGLKEIIDIRTWHVIGAQINGGYCDYDWAEAMPAAKVSGLASGGLQWDQSSRS